MERIVEMSRVVRIVRFRRIRVWEMVWRVCLL